MKQEKLFIHSRSCDLYNISEGVMSVRKYCKSGKFVSGHCALVDDTLI